jgi:hypothetical protein
VRRPAPSPYLRYGVSVRSALPVMLAAGVLAAPAAAGATSYSFGRVGGNIAPFTIAVAADGSVSTTGFAKPTKTRVAPRAMAALAATVRAQHFFTLPATVRCSGALPDFASNFVVVRSGGRRHKVLVHGGCSTRFEKVYAALAAAVGIRP